MSEFEIESGTHVADIENALSQGDIDSLRISPSLAPPDLAGVITTMRASAYATTFLELLASGPMTDSVVWRAVLEHPVDTRVAMTALGNPRIPQHEVVRLLAHPSSQVQGHALLARLQHQIPLLTESELNELLDAHGGDGGVSLGVRHLVARSPATPRRVLQRLVDDDADFVAESARRQLQE